MRDTTHPFDHRRYSGERQRPERGANDLPGPWSCSHCLQASRNRCVVQNECMRFSSIIFVISALAGLNTSRCLSNAASRNLALFPSCAQQEEVEVGESRHEQRLQYLSPSSNKLCWSTSMMKGGPRPYLKDSVSHSCFDVDLQLRPRRDVHVDNSSKVHINVFGRTAFGLCDVLSHLQLSQ